MLRSSWRRAGLAVVAIPALLLTGCAETPMGPMVPVMPAPGKPLEAFQADQYACRAFAEQAVAGMAQNANNRAVGGAALTTLLGAGLGAALGGGRGAAIGAASGALSGAGIGAASSSNEQMGIQGQYDTAYAQCMYTKGNMVPGYGPMMVQQPPPPPPPSPPPAPEPGLTRAVQVQLIRLGYLNGPADGVLGPQTSNAISQFESVSGLPIDGMPSGPVLARLQSIP